MRTFLVQKAKKILVWLPPRSIHWLVIYFVIWLALGFWAMYVVENQMVNAIGRTTGNLMGSMLSNDFSQKDFAGQLSPDLSQKLDTAFTIHRLQANHIRGIKVFDLKGKVIYASDYQGTGGYETKDIKLIQKGNVATTETDGTYSVFVPIELGSPAKRVGTFEFYFEPVNLSGSLDKIRVAIGLFILLGSLLTLAAIKLLVQRATTTIESKSVVVEGLSKRLDESKTILDQSNSGTVAALLTALDAKDRYTAQHSSNVAAYAIRIGQKLNLSKYDIKALENAAILHDVGKIGIEETVLNKRGSLDNSEFNAIKRHPEIGAQIVHLCYSLEGIAEIIVYHHERYDGSGYPKGLSGNAIPLGARILAVADVYDAITTDRPYRSAIHKGKARVILEQGKGTQFDPVVVDAFLGVLQEDSVA